MHALRANLRLLTEFDTSSERAIRFAHQIVRYYQNSTLTRSLLSQINTTRVTLNLSWLHIRRVLVESESRPTYQLSKHFIMECTDACALGRYQIHKPWCQGSWLRGIGGGKPPPRPLRHSPIHNPKSKINTPNSRIGSHGSAIPPHRRPTASGISSQVRSMRIPQSTDPPHDILTAPRGV